MAVSDRGAPPLVRWTAYAKINLYLHVVGRRADGLHLIDSLIAFAAIGDEVRATPAGDLSLEVGGPFADGLRDNEDNLVLHAARALAATSAEPVGARLALTKNLPVAAGLGGGSADAAAALRLLARLWRSGLTEPDLLALAASLGTDVPACLVGRPLYVAGVGDEITPAPALPPVHVALVNPGVELTTAEVYAAFSGPGSPPPDRPPTVTDLADLVSLLSLARNDLAAAASELEPTIGRVLACLWREPDCLLARMSGSGATCFGLFADERAARRAAASVRASNRGWWTAHAPLLRPAAVARAA